MKEKRLLRAMGQVDKQYIEETSSYNSVTERTPRFHRLSVALIAAILSVCLIGAGVATVIYGDHIQSWFSHCWEVITGQPMSEDHLAVIEHLSQKIEISQTVGDVTITIDSATVGDDNFFLLLRVDGMDFSDRHSYDFQHVRMETKPDPLADGAFVGYGIDYLGLDGDGTPLLLLNYEYAGGNSYMQDSRPLEVWLTLQNLVKDAHTDNQETLLEGDWYFSFAINRSQSPEVILLPDTEVMAIVLDTHEEIPVTVTNIELTNTGLRLQYPHEEGTLSLSNQEIKVVLENGNTIGNNGGIGNPTEENIAMDFSCQWLVPVNLDEVASILIGETEINVP